MNRHFFFAAATSFAFVVGCNPTAGERGGPTVSSGASASGTGGSASSLPGAGRAASVGGQAIGGTGRVAATRAPEPMGDPGVPCDVCTSALGGSQSSTLCGPSQTALDAILACACSGACASVCGNSAPGSCLDAWAGNPPLACKTCLVSPTGCGPAWDACISDDGMTPPGGGSSSAGTGGGTCSCDSAAPLCPGGGSCATPGPFDGPGNQACGSAQYCAPCCDPGDACALQGACTMTLVDQAPCSMDYECCSGVCTAGKCDGGCGIVISF
jgi:hypothetical protein